MLNVKAPQITSAPSGNLEAPGWPGGISPAPLLPGEDKSDYNKLTAQFLAAAKPRDFIEEILARDAIDLSWEILRLRRLKAGLLRMAVSAGVRSVAGELGFNGSVYDFAAKWMSGDAKTRERFAEILKKADLGMEDVIAAALSSEIDAFERIDRMLASAEARRNTALREIDRHREAMGTAMRRSIDEAEDVEFRDVETGKTRGAGEP
jgi:hypothetical protein